MSSYLQFDSSARANPFIQKNLGSGNVWVPNDDYPLDSNDPPAVYQTNRRLIQTPTNYRVFYKEINSPNNIRTIGFLAHCRERPTNLTYSVESCILTLPANALVLRTDEDGNRTYTSILNEPYVYVKMVPINHSEGELIYSNNPPCNDATFVLWCDKVQLGTEDGSPPITDPVDRPNMEIRTLALNTPRWIIYKTCMITVMRLDLQADEWLVRIFDRYGNDIVLSEGDNGGVGFEGEEPPDIDPELQTMVMVGIKPNYPL